MFKNYIKVAWRNITKRKLLSCINIICLAMGFCFALIIGTYIIQQKSVNQQFSHINNQYLIRSDWKSKDMGADITNIAPFAKALKEEYPHLVKNYYRYNPVSNVVSAGNKYFKEEIAIGDTNFVSMYGLPVVYGNAEKAFDNNHSAVITASFAKKMFGSENPIGKTISIQTVVADIKQDYSVSAVLEDIPYNSVFNQGYFEGYAVFIPREGCHFFPGSDPFLNWENTACVSAVELNEGITAKDLMQPSRQILAKYASAFLQQNLTVSYAAISDFYLKDNNGAVSRMITTLSLIGTFILVMAIFNFVNTSTATASYRLKEIGLRKVFGSGRRQLIFQFLTEAWLLALAAGLLAILLYETTRPYFSQILGTTLIPIAYFSTTTLAGFVFLVLFIGLLSGAYPAFMLSRSGVTTAVKGKLQSKGGGILFRRVVLIIQFSMAILVFIGAAIVTQQVNFIFNRDMGYNKDQLLVITAYPKRWDSIGVQKMEHIKRGLLQLPEVQTATISFDLPDRVPVNSPLDILPLKGGTTPVPVPSFVSDEDYGATFQLQMEAGNFLNHKKSFIPGQVVINETAAGLLGVSSNDIGKELKLLQGASLTLTGIVKDYNASSMQQAIAPLAIYHIEDGTAYRYLTIKLKNATINTIERIKASWQKLSPNTPFEYTFMDEKFAALYKSELQLKKAASTATLLSLIIVFLGIFGVVSVMLTKREKEIAVRKVLGAEVQNIFSLFIKEYVLMLSIANLISWPLAYYSMSAWLDNYAYRTQQNISIYIAVAAILLVLVCLLVGMRTFKAAITTPARSLRTE